MLTMLTICVALVGFMNLIDTGISPQMAVSHLLCMTQDETQTVAQHTSGNGHASLRGVNTYKQRAATQLF